MLLTDADSVMYKIEVENVNEDFYKDEELFSFTQKIQNITIMQITRGKNKRWNINVTIKSFVG